jgi:hypothetical protein
MPKHLPRKGARAKEDKGTNRPAPEAWTPRQPGDTYSSQSFLRFLCFLAANSPGNAPDAFIGKEFDRG